MSGSVKLPIKEFVRATYIKLPLIQTAWVLVGFLISERVVRLLTKEVTLIENIKSRILLDVSLIDKGHIKLSWYGDRVPKLEIYKADIGSEWDEPIAVVDWTPQEYVMLADSTSFMLKVEGSDDTGSGDSYTLGDTQGYGIDMTFELPINEKYYFLDIPLCSEYHIEVSL